MNELQFDELQYIDGGRQHKGLASDIGKGAIIGVIRGATWGFGVGGPGGAVCGAAIGGASGSLGAIGMHAVWDSVHWGD